MNKIFKYLIILTVVGALAIGSYFALKRHINSKPEKTKTEIIQEWQDYVPTFNKGLEDLLEDNVLFAVHPGCVKIHGSIKYYNKHGYQTYFKNIKNKITESIRNGRTVVLYIEEDYKKETLDILRIKGVTQVILVPTYDSGKERIDIPPYMDISHEEFYKIVSRKVKTGEICGELSRSCLGAVENDLKDAGINIRRLEDYIFPFAD